MAEQYRIERVEYVVGDGYRYRIRETDEWVCQIQYQEWNGVDYVDEGKPFETSFDALPLISKAAQSVCSANHE